MNLPGQYKSKNIIDIPIYTGNETKEQIDKDMKQFFAECN